MMPVNDASSSFFVQNSVIYAHLRDSLYLGMIPAEFESNARSNSVGYYV